MSEKTLILIKPDGVQKQLIGEILSRIEKNNLKIKAIKMVLADDGILNKHYPLKEDWAKSIFKKSKNSAEKENRPFDFTDYMEFGKIIQTRNKQSLAEGPIIPMIVEGPQAITIIRNIVGATEPKQAEKGTIRGDFASEESYELADKENRAVRNIIHASDSIENAEKEISIWFQEYEIHEY